MTLHDDNNKGIAKLDIMTYSIGDMKGLALDLMFAHCKATTDTTINIYHK